MFGNVSYGEIWNAVEKLFERGLAIDTITVGDELERGYKLDSVSNGARAGRALLSDLRSNGDPRNAESYAENIQDYHVKKMLEDYGKRMVVWSANGRRSADIMQDVNKLLGEIVLYSGQAQNHIYDIAQAVSGAYDDTTAASQGMIRRVQSGLVDLDRLLNGGYVGGDFIIKAARPGQGKTALLLTETLNMMREGSGVLFFSLEMSAKQIANRLLSQMSGIDSGRIQAGKLRPEEWAVYTNAVDELSSMRDLLTVIDLSAIRSGNIRQIVRREMARKKYRTIMVDYLQLATADGKTENRQVEVSQISRGLKALAREMDVPVIAAAQLSRAIEQRTNKRPMLSDLRESGSLEQDADIVMFIHRDEEVKESPVNEIIVAKQRNGAVGDIPVTFKKEITRFESAAMFSPNK
jgi:replicative DNA helicase